MVNSGSSAPRPDGAAPLHLGPVCAGYATAAEDVDLADAIAALRLQLGDALREGEGDEVRFRLGQVELEFTLNVKRNADVRGGVQFWVVSLGGSAGRASEEQHRIKLTLQAGDDLVVRSDQRSRPR